MFLVLLMDQFDPYQTQDTAMWNTCITHKTLLCEIHVSNTRHCYV